MRLPHILLLGMLMTVFLAPSVLAVSGGVIVPQVDPQPDEGYVDVYYHKCPVTGSAPCSHHHLARVPLPCTDPSVEPGPGAVVVRNCGNEHVVATPCVDPAVDSDTNGPHYGATVSNCGTSLPVGPVCFDWVGVDDNWFNSYGDLYRIHDGECSNVPDVWVCQELVTQDGNTWAVRDYRCQPVACTHWSLNADNSVTVSASCSGSGVTTPCLDTQGTSVGPSGGSVGAAVVVCGQTYADQSVTPPAPTAPCGSAGSGGGNTVYVRIYPTCDYSDPADPQPTSTPTEHEFHVGP